jgi:two-component system cell cycle response regulator
MDDSRAEQPARTLRGDLSRVRTSLRSDGVLATLGERTRSFTTGHRLAVVALATFVPLFIVSAVLVDGLRLTAEEAAVASAVGAQVEAVLPATAELAEAEELLGRYLASGSGPDRATFAAQADVVDRAFEDLRAALPDRLGDDIEDARSLWAPIRTEALSEELAGDPVGRMQAAMSFDGTFTSIQNRLIDVAEDASRIGAASAASQAVRASRLRLLLLVGVPLSFLLGLSLVSWLMRDLRHGTARLRDAAARIQQGRTDVRVDVMHGDLAPVAQAFNDMAERIQRQQRELHQAANRDELTGVLNRRGMDDELRTELERTERYGSSLALLLLDIDHFKRVNDTHGHPVGDVVLRAVAQEVVEAVRGVDRVGRWGGEEFAVLLPETELGAARHVARRINQVVRERVVVADGQRLHVTVSIGVTVHDPAAGVIDVETLVDRADRGLYEAKESGRDRVVVAS